MDSVTFLVWLEHLRSGVTDWIFIRASWLGLSYPYMAILVAIYLCVGHRVGIRLLVVFLLSAYSNGHLKMAFHTVRPFVRYPEIFANALYTESAGGGSFPSGHAQNAAAVYGLIATRLRSWPARGAVILLIGLIAFSRLYCQVHWPVDVIGGLLIGVFLMFGFLAVLGAWQASSREPTVTQWAVLVVVVAGLMNLLALVRLHQEAYGVEDVEDCLRASGALLGVGLGYLLLKGRGYDARTSPGRQVLKVAVAMPLLFGVHSWMGEWLKDAAWALGISDAVVGFTTTYVLPVLFTQCPVWRARIGGRERSAAQSECSE